MTKMVITTVIITALFLFPEHRLSAFEIKGNYATIIYSNKKQLQSFNNNLYMGRLRYLMRGKKALTIEDEVTIKIDVITEKVKQILEMHPPHLTFSISLCDDMECVKETSLKLHRKQLKHPAFYSPVTDTIYISVKNTKLRVVAHEFGHVVVEKYFKVRPPVKVHELLAQFAEKHISD